MSKKPKQEPKAPQNKEKSMQATTNESQNDKATASDFSVSSVVELSDVINNRTLRFVKLGVTESTGNGVALPQYGKISGTIEGIIDGKFGPELLLGNSKELMTIKLSGGLKVALARANASEGDSVTITYKGKAVISEGRLKGKTANRFDASVNEAS